ncbi:MAG: serine acetyltransferase [Buchnera aphidicola (Floraphis meitanensis)]
MFSEEVKLIWNQILSEAQILINQEPVLVSFYYSYILNHRDFTSALSYILSSKLGNNVVSSIFIRDIINNVYISNNAIVLSAIKDVQSIYHNYPEIKCYSIPFLYFKGFHALQAYRVCHHLWNNQRQELAIYFQSCISAIFSVDIHPAVQIENKVILDNATGISISNATIIKSNMSNFRSTKLNNIKKDNFINYPIIRKEVFIGSGVKILGDIEIGSRSIISSGSIVLISVPPNSIVN